MGLVRPSNAAGGETPGRSNDAEAAYREAVRIKPDFGPFWARLEDLLRRVPGRQLEAETAYKRAVELNASLAWAWYALGTLLIESPGRSAEAEEVLRKSAELNPESFRRDVGLKLYLEYWIGEILERHYCALRARPSRMILS